MYTFDEALQASTEYFKGDDLAAKVFVDKYALRNNKKEILEKTPDDMHRRLAKEFARIEAKKFKEPYTEEFIYDLFKNYKYISPQGSPIAAIANPYQLQSAANCFVLTPPLDSYNSIHNTDQQLTAISKRRGGVGIDISHLRPAGTPTSNASRTSTGIIPFMERYSNSIREVGQNARRGALMITLSVHHPEVARFADCKHDREKITGANISVRLSDEFMNAVKNDTEYEQRWPVDSKTPSISIKVKARDLWKKFIYSAWFCAEPGLLFWDNIIKESPADCYADVGFRTVSTNPCAELPLSELDSCRLLIVNLLSCVKNAFTKDAYFDFKLFYKLAQIAQRLMDDLVDLELELVDKILTKIQNDPEPQSVKQFEIDLWKKIKENCTNGRRTGTGITALGDTLASLNLIYGTEQASGMAEAIYKILKFGCYRSSIDMAKELGPFPVWDYEKEKDNPFLNRFKNDSISLIHQPGVFGLVQLKTELDNWISGSDMYYEMKKYGRRNISLLTTAPTGTLSIQTQTTSGVEPAVQIEYGRRKKINPNDEHARVDFVDQSGDKWQEFDVYHHKVKEWMEVTGKTDIKESPWWGACCEDLDWKERVKMQGRIQQHVDHSISSTVNLPEDISEEEVANIYMEGWLSGCKGITVYRKNSRTGVLVDKKEKSGTINGWNKRPEILDCDVHHSVIKGHEFFVVVSKLNGVPYEVFSGNNIDLKAIDDEYIHRHISKKYTEGKVEKVKRGHYKLVNKDNKEICDNISIYCNEGEEAVTRLVSTLLRHGVEIRFILDQLEKSKGEIHSFSKALSRVLKKYVKDGEKVSGANCPECGNELRRIEGCISCTCGYSKC